LNFGTDAPKVRLPEDSGDLSAVASPYLQGISDKAAPTIDGGNLLLLVQLETSISPLASSTAWTIGQPPSPSPVSNARARAFFLKNPDSYYLEAKILGCRFFTHFHIELTVTSSNSANYNDIYSAATAGERASRVREWLAGSPSHEQLSAAFKELSVKDKGAAKLVREKLDELKRSKNQEALAAEWVAKAQTLLDVTKLNIADALAWQRDAAKAGAPLSKEPLASLKTQLLERVRTIEDLQHQVQVQREAAVLLAQRIEVLSTKSWKDAQTALDTLRADVEHWQTQAGQLVMDASWPSVDLKFPALLEASKAQLLVVWDAFQGALALAVVAVQDPMAALPPVPVWADEVRVGRGVPLEAAPKQAKPQVDPQVRAAATTAVGEALAVLEREVAEGHGKASAGAAGALRQALKEFGKLIDGKLENKAHTALSAAGELEGWQRWRADQIREELVAKAEGLLKRPEGQAMGGRKMQETLRAVREQWKQTDQGGIPNHALWKRFDEACNEAHKVVEGWLEKLKTETAEHKAQRLALIEEVNQWATDNRTARDDDWKGFNRVLHQFGDRWREGGHVGEKVFAELQPLWKTAISNAAEPLEVLQAQSLALRQAMIEEAKVLGDAPVLRMDAVKSLQQRWQAQAHTVPMDRRQEQKLWDAFRKPIDDAFNRKTVDREKAEATLGARDRVVLDAAKALEAANASGDAQRIRAAMAALDAALSGQALAQAEVRDAGAQETQAKAAVQANESESNTAEAPVDTAQAAIENVATDAPVEVAPAPKAAPKPVVAMRGDDRPGMRKETPAPAAGRAGKWADRKDAPRGAREDRPPRTGGWTEAPRLGDTAFRAQRDALEHAQLALKKLAAQAHGEALTQLLSAWEKRDASLMPSVQELGGRTNAALRTSWSQAVAESKSPVKGMTAPEALLRLEMAAEVPTPADLLSDRRALQLQLLTRRNDPAPAQTWGQDAAVVLAGNFAEAEARRLQNVLKVLFKR
jgi:ATP-dependent RNA helicase SUPV3L1/SUV3